MLLSKRSWPSRCQRTPRHPQARWRAQADAAPSRPLIGLVPEALELRGVSSCRGVEPCTLLIDQPMQELCVARAAPVVRLAPSHVGIEVGRGMDVPRLDVGQPEQTIGFGPGQSNLRSETKHGVHGCGIYPQYSRRSARERKRRMRRDCNCLIPSTPVALTCDWNRRRRLVRSVDATPSRAGAIANPRETGADARGGCGHRLVGPSCQTTLSTLSIV